MLVPLLNRVRRLWLSRELAVFHDPAYRLPLANLEGQAGMEPRRADFVAYYLLDRRVLSPQALRSPPAASWADLARVHEESWLDSITLPQTLARVFATSPSEVPVDELLRSLRLACGGTLTATWRALATGRPQLNLLGGFHHAGRGFGGGFCAVNDLAVAIASARAHGFGGRIAVLDLDAHPPDGTADCLAADPRCWIGSLSGARWSLPPEVDETVLEQAGDESYLAALGSLLSRMPKAELAFVLAGGDVLQGDRLGTLALTLDGARRRDLLVKQALAGIPSVWLPAGGYHPDAWKVLAGTALVLALDSRRPIPPSYDPLAAKFRAIAAGLLRADLAASEAEEDAQLEVMLGLRHAPRPALLLGYYTASGLEHALMRYGILGQLARLGYSELRVALDPVDQGDCLRVFGRAHATEQLLVECVLAKKRVTEADMLYVHWLTLRHPIATFEPSRPRLPGQEVPGLGLAREAGEMLAATARRLDLAGVAFRPAWFHTAYSARYRFRFIDPQRQGQFLALVRDLAALPLLEATLALAEGRVRRDDQPYTWEADEMVFFLDRPPAEDQRAAEAAQHVHFTVAPRA